MSVLWSFWTKISFSQWNQTCVFRSGISLHSDTNSDVFGENSNVFNDCQISKETQTDLLDFLEKDHTKHQSKHVAQLSSSVNGRHVIIVDDMIDTGHTINIALKVIKWL